MPDKKAIEDTFELLETILETEDFRKKLVDVINEHIDLPLVNEKTERKLIRKLYAELLKYVRERNEKNEIKEDEDKKD